MKNVSTNKKTDADQVIKKTKVIGKPVDKHDFWFYAEGVEDEEGNLIEDEDDEESFDEIFEDIDDMFSDDDEESFD